MPQSIPGIGLSMTKWTRTGEPAYIGALHAAYSAPFVVSLSEAGWYLLLIPAMMAFVGMMLSTHLARGDIACGAVLVVYLAGQAALWMAFWWGATPDMTHWPDPNASMRQNNDVVSWMTLLLAVATVPAVIEVAKRSHELGREHLVQANVRGFVLGFVVVVQVVQFSFFALLFFFPPGWLVSGAILLLVLGLVRLVDRHESILSLALLTAVVGTVSAFWAHALFTTDGGPDVLVAGFAGSGAIALVGLLVVSVHMARERLQARRQLDVWRMQEQTRITEINMRAADHRSPGCP